MVYLWKQCHVHVLHIRKEESRLFLLSWRAFSKILYMKVSVSASRLLVFTAEAEKWHWFKNDNNKLSRVKLSIYLIINNEHRSTTVVRELDQSRCILCRQQCSSARDHSVLHSMCADELRLILGFEQKEAFCENKSKHHHQQQQQHTQPHQNLKLNS